MLFNYWALPLKMHIFEIDIFYRLVLLQSVQFFSGSMYLLRFMFLSIFPLSKCSQDNWKSAFFLLSWQTFLGNKFFHHNHAAYQSKLESNKIKTTQKNCRKGVSSTPLIRTKTLTMGQNAAKLVWIFTTTCHNT